MLIYLILSEDDIINDIINDVREGRENIRILEFRKVFMKVNLNHWSRFMVAKS